MLGPDEQRRELELEEHRLHEQRVILKFRGIDSINEAQRLVGAEIQVTLAERHALEGDAKYISDLEGCRVVDAGHDRMEIGVVREVQLGAGEAPLLVVERGKREVLLPFAAQYLKRVDVADKCIEMILPEGLLQLDAPLTGEEKQRQARGE